MKLQHNLMNLFIWIELFIYLISYKELIIVHELTNKHHKYSNRITQVY